MKKILETLNPTISINQAAHLPVMLLSKHFEL